MAHRWHWRYLLRLASICLAGIGMCAGVCAETLRLATGELPPYATEQRPDQGIALDIIRRAFANEGIDVQYFFKPWTRSLEEARDGKWDGTAYWGRNLRETVLFSSAVETLAKVFPGRQIRGLDAVDLAWGLGAYHCITQQQPV